MSEYVVGLEAIRQADSGRVGGKAAVLGTLIDAGFPVPAGICLTTAAFHLAFAPYHLEIRNILRDYDLRDPVGATAAAAMIAPLLDSLSIPDAVVEELQRFLPGIASGDAALAVRSSATAEDRADASFAGQYATLLGVRGDKAVWDAVIECWRSFFTTNALAERAAHAAIEEYEGMGVLIQRMVDAECAGVCFSVDPVRQQRGLIVVEAAWGLGIGTVDGDVATDTYWVRREDFTIDEQHIVEKAEQIGLDAAQGVKRLSVSEERQKAASLPERWVQRIARFGLAAELLLGTPQDLEWSIADNKVWILQSRPITTLPQELAKIPLFPIQWVKESDRRLGWDLSDFSRDEILTPLGLEVARLFRQAWSDATRITGRREIQDALLINGRIYSTGKPVDLRPGDLRIRQQAQIDLDLRLRKEGKTLWDHIEPEIIAATERLAAFDRDTAGPAELADHLEDAFGAFLRHWTLHWLIWSDATHPYYTAFEKVSGLSEREARQAAAQYLEGEETKLTQMIDKLYELAQIAREIPALAELVTNPAEDVTERLVELPEAEEFRTKFDAFLALYGDRTGNGYGSKMDVHTATWRENPALVLRMIAPYLDPALESPAAARARAVQERDAQFEALCAACADAEAVAELRQWLPDMRRHATVLENHNHYIDQMSDGQLRAAYMAAARKLVELGVLAEAEEIYWLERDEIGEALRAATPVSAAARIAERKAQNAEWAALEPPPFLGTPKATLEPRPPLKDEVNTEQAVAANQLKGMAASPGRHRGRARIVTGVVLLPDVEPGDVLVAPNAGPLWTPIFPRLGGLVLDHGAMSQHAATTAREYGVPAVLNTGKATRRIREGAWVTVDGTAGIVELEDEA